MYYIKFGEILKNLRIEKGLNQTDLAELLNLSRAIVSKYESALSYPSYNILIRIANLFKVSTDFLLGVEKKKTININGLTDGQINILISTANEYRRLNEDIEKVNKPK